MLMCCSLTSDYLLCPVLCSSVLPILSVQLCYFFSLCLYACTANRLRNWSDEETSFFPGIFSDRSVTGSEWRYSGFTDKRTRLVWELDSGSYQVFVSLNDLCCYCVSCFPLDTLPIQWKLGWLFLCCSSSKWTATLALFGKELYFEYLQC